MILRCARRVASFKHEGETGHNLSRLNGCGHFVNARLGELP